MAELKIWLVDGQRVREMMKTDFHSGGHAMVYPFIPEDEIWIDSALHTDERPYVIKHEFTERMLMEHGIDYDNAHDEASRVEWRMRQEAEEKALPAGNLFGITPQTTERTGTAQSGVVRSSEEVAAEFKACPCCGGELKSDGKSLWCSIPPCEYHVKAMSWLAEGSGGVLVAPPAIGRVSPLRRNGSLLLDPEGRKRLRAKYLSISKNFNAVKPDTELSDTSKPIEGEIKSFTQGDHVEITDGEYAGRTGKVYGMPLPKHGAIGTPLGRFGETVYRVQIDGFPKSGGWNGQVTVKESWLRKKSLGKDFLAYHNGQEARNRGESRHACPYPGGSANCEDWLMGWRGEMFRGKVISRAVSIKSQNPLLTI